MGPRAKSNSNEDHLYKDQPHRKDNVFQISINLFSKLRIEHGSKHWKGLEQYKIIVHLEIGYKE